MQNLLIQKQILKHLAKSAYLRSEDSLQYMYLMWQIHIANPGACLMQVSSCICKQLS